MSRTGTDQDTRVRTLSTGGPRPGRQHPEEIRAEGRFQGQLKVKGFGVWRTFQAGLSQQPGKPQEQSVGLPASQEPPEGVPLAVVAALSGQGRPPGPGGQGAEA